MLLIDPVLGKEKMTMGIETLHTPVSKMMNLFTLMLCALALVDLDVELLILQKIFVPEFPSLQ